MASALHAKADGTMPAEFFHDLLDEHFTEANRNASSISAIQWGRYADYSTTIP